MDSATPARARATPELPEETEESLAAEVEGMPPKLRAAWLKEYTAEDRAELRAKRSKYAAARDAILESPTIVPLVISKAGAKWGGTEIVKVAQEVGRFRWQEGDYRHLVLRGDRKSRPRAVLHYDTSAASLPEGGVSEICVLLDPVRFELHHMTFERSVEVARKMAAALSAEVIDIDGNILTDARAADMKVAFNRAVEAETERLQVVHIQPDGTVKKEQLVSFATMHKTKRGRFLDSNHFDVPALSYAEGYVVGLEKMQELLCTLRDCNQKPHPDVNWILEAAFAAGSPTFNDRKSVANVARPFINVVADALFFFAHHCGNLEMVMEQRIAQAKKDQEWMQRRDAEEKERIVAQLRAGREKAARGRALDARKAPAAEPKRRASRNSRAEVTQ